MSEFDVRKQKIARLEEKGINPWPAKYDKKNNLDEVIEKNIDKKIKTAGRVMTKRTMGKIAFVHLQDFFGKAQAVFQIDNIGKEDFKTLEKLVDIGDFIGIEGEVFKTQKGEISVSVKKFEFLGKALNPLPEKFHGLKDQETIYRQRYLDLIMNKESKDRFVLRSNLVKAIREFYWKKGFYEVETPTFMHKATGANAMPYKTHHNAFDIDVYLRISHELPLKELIVAGFEKIFELGKAFRNEGYDPSHLPEHTHLEHYAAYWDFEKNIEFTEELFDHIFDTLKLDRKIKIKDKEGKEREVDFTTPWPRIDYVELIKGDTGLDISEYKDEKSLISDLKKNNIKIEGIDKMSLGTIIDNLYKKVSRPKIINPTFLVHYPVACQPLARRNDKEPEIVDQFQLVINGWELLKAYSELVDPVDQRDRFKQQSKAKKMGDDEAMEVDEEYLTAMEYGMPPISGWGMGIDRLTSFLTGQDNLRDVVLFPLTKPKE